MGTIGLLYSILQTYLTNAWLDHRWKVRSVIYGLGFSIPNLYVFFGEKLWVKILCFGVMIASIIFLPLLYGFLQLERLSPEEAKRKKNMRALERIAKREMQ